MKTLYVMCGCPGLGKSTWIVKNLHKFKGYTAVVSRDAIRFSLLHEGEDYFARENEVYAKFINDIKFGLENADNVIADATHLNEASRTKLLRKLGASLKNVEIIAIVLKGSLELALERNENRKDTLSYVPEDVIRNMYRRFTMPRFIEGFHKIIIYDGTKYIIREERK